MRRVSLTLPTTLALALTAAVGTAAVTTHTDELQTAAAAAETAVEFDGAKLKQARKLSKLVARARKAKTLAAELASVASAAKVFETKLPEQAGLQDAFDLAAYHYGLDLSATRGLLVLASESPTLSAASRKRYGAALARFDRANPQLAGKRRAAATPLATRFRQYSAAARAGAGFTPFDAGTTYDWVIRGVESASSAEGVDLDGDGTPDNALGSAATLLGIDIAAQFDAALGAEGSFALIEMWYAKDLVKPDPFVLVGVHSAVDADADAENNFTGTGTFVTSTERPAAYAAASLLKGGKYRVELGDATIQFAAITLPPGSKLIVTGTATQTTNSGSIGVGLPIGTLVALLADQGTPLTIEQQAALAFLADLDLDPAVPGNDAISLSLTFDAVAATRVVVQ